MSSDTDGLPRAVPSSTAADASHSLQIVPEKLAEHTIQLGEAIAQFVAPTAPNEAAEALESVHEVHEGLQSRLSIMRMEASLTKVSAVRVRFSKSFARRRQRLSQANVRSTIQRLGRTSKPLA